jgi:hypothetical protein
MNCDEVQGIRKDVGFIVVCPYLLGKFEKLNG